MSCPHGRRYYGCYRCARHILMSPQGAMDAAESVRRSVLAELSERDRYIEWLEDRISDLEDADPVRNLGDALAEAFE